MKKTYITEIEINAQQYGYKAANLIFLSSLLTKNNAGVPPFKAIASDEIIAFLNSHAKNWQTDWQNFISHYQKTKSLDQTAINYLANLRTKIEKTFTKYQFQTELSESLLNSLFVRSTGYEDSADIANPGGNASYPATHETLSATIGRVIASSFSEKSLRQRIISGAKITEDPFLPVLVQKKVGSGKRVVSGVIYVERNGWARINAAFGAGEGVVAGLVPNDEYQIINGVVYAKFATTHMQTILTANGDTQIKPAGDLLDMQFWATMTEPQAYQLANISQEIAAAYQMDMDIEFVLDDEKLFIVQARAQTRNAPKQAPLGLNPELINQCERFTARNITCDINTAIILRHAAELFIGRDINQALAFYLETEQKQPPKAILIIEDAPANSHEAGQFTAMGIPVIQFSNPAIISEFLANGKQIVIDTQRKAMFILPDNCPQTEILATGYFASTLEPDTNLIHPRMININHNLDDFDEKTEDSSPLPSSLGDWIYAARKNHTAKNLLTNSLFKNIQNVEHFNSNNTINTALESLMLDPIDNQQKHATNILRLLRTIINLRKQNKISALLTQHIQLTGAHLLDVLQQNDNPNQQRIWLDICEKFTALFTSTTGLSLRTDSLAVFQKKISPLLSTTSKKQMSNDNNLAACLILIPCFLTAGNAWENFCLKIAKDKLASKQLALVVARLVALNIHEPWCNITCTPILQSEFSEQEKLKIILQDFQDLEKIINNLEQPEKQLQQIKQLCHGSTAGNETTISELTAEIKQLSQSLLKEEENNSSPFCQFIIMRMQKNLIEILDNTIKQIIFSQQFVNTKQQVVCLQKMLQIFLALLRDWMPQTVNENSKNAILQYATEILKHKPTPADLRLSGSFNVSTANISSTIIGADGWSRVLAHCKTLHDLFTLLHQNLLKACELRQTKIQDLLSNQLPAKMQNLCAALEAETYDGNSLSIMAIEHNSGITSIEYNMPLRNHSAILQISQQNNIIILKAIAFGHNADERWDCAALMPQLYLTNIHGATLIHEPAYDEKTQSLEFIADITHADFAGLSRSLARYLAAHLFSMQDLAEPLFFVKYNYPIEISENKIKNIFTNIKKFDLLLPEAYADLVNAAKLLPNEKDESKLLIDAIRHPKFNDEISLTAMFTAYKVWPSDKFQTISDLKLTTESDISFEKLGQWFDAADKNKIFILTNDDCIESLNNGYKIEDIEACYDQWTTEKFNQGIKLAAIYNSKHSALELFSNWYDQGEQEKISTLTNQDYLPVLVTFSIDLNKIAMFYDQMNNTKDFQFILNYMINSDRYLYSYLNLTLEKFGQYYNRLSEDKFIALFKQITIETSFRYQMELDDITNWCEQWPVIKFNTIIKIMCNSICFFKYKTDKFPITQLIELYDQWGPEKTTAMMKNSSLGLLVKEYITQTQLSELYDAWQFTKFNKIIPLVNKIPKEIIPLNKFSEWYDQWDQTKFDTLTSKTCIDIVVSEQKLTIDELIDCYHSWPIEKFKIITNVISSSSSYKENIISLENLNNYFELWQREKFNNLMDGKCLYIYSNRYSTINELSTLYDNSATEKFSKIIDIIFNCSYYAKKDLTVQNLNKWYDTWESEKLNVLSEDNIRFCCNQNIKLDELLACYDEHGLDTLNYITYKLSYDKYSHQTISFSVMVSWYKDWDYEKFLTLTDREVLYVCNNFNIDPNKMIQCYEKFGQTATQKIVTLLADKIILASDLKNLLSIPTERAKEFITDFEKCSSEQDVEMLLNLFIEKPPAITNQLLQWINPNINQAKTNATNNEIEILEMKSRI